MVADPVFFRDLALVFVAAVFGAILARLAHQPLILGYVVAGVALSPLTPGPAVSDIHTFELFAEIGVVLLMFSIGIEFSLRDLLRVKWVAIVGGPLGIVLSVVLGVAVGGLLGWTVIQGMVVGMVVSVASTMVLARLLVDRGELHSRHGRIMIGITLVEDLAVVVLIVLVPRLGALDTDRLISIGAALGLGIAILVPVFYLAARVAPPILTYVVRMRSQEVFLLVALAIALGTAAVTQEVGLSLALGAFLAGLLISGSDYAHETLARLLPIRDVFVALFFVTIGALINPWAVFDSPRLLGVIVTLVVLGKLIIWTGVVLLFRHPFWTAVLVGLGLTQIGEFSFILIQVARMAGHVGTDVYNAVLAASMLTILINAFLVRTLPGWIKKVRVARDHEPTLGDTGARGLDGHVIVCGFGRVGSQVAEALETFQAPYVAIDLDPDVVKNVRRRGVHCLFGDASSDHILMAASVDRAAMVILAVPEIEGAYLAVRRIRARNLHIPILARAHNVSDGERLIKAGATEIIQPEFEAAATLIRHALRRLQLPRDRVLAYLDRFRVTMEDAAPGGALGEALPEISDVILEDSSLTDQSLRDARIRERFAVTVVALTRASGDFVLHPAPDTILRPGDRVRVFGLPAQIEDFRRAAREGP
ncbi:MAG TPA: cation:proton antiporter [Methylomirabilota bacterium]|nr:cation:proton antiporter [Methylomirabilota bacterium]